MKPKQTSAESLPAYYAKDAFPWVDFETGLTLGGFLDGRHGTFRREYGLVLAADAGRLAEAGARIWKSSALALAVPDDVCRAFMRRLADRDIQKLLVPPHPTEETTNPVAAAMSNFAAGWRDARFKAVA